MMLISNRLVVLPLLLMFATALVACEESGPLAECQSMQGPDRLMKCHLACSAGEAQGCASAASYLVQYCVVPWGDVHRSGPYGAPPAPTQAQRDQWEGSRDTCVSVCEAIAAAEPSYDVGTVSQCRDIIANP